MLPVLDDVRAVCHEHSLEAAFEGVEDRRDRISERWIGTQVTALLDGSRSLRGEQIPTQPCPLDGQKLYLRVFSIVNAMNGGEQLESIIDRIKEHANVETVYGEPIERNGKTVIPVAKVAYGFGGGYGSEARKEPQEDGKDHNGGEGGGVGGGVKATPAGVVEITDYETRFIKFTNIKKLAAIAGLFLVFGYLLGRD